MDEYRKKPVVVNAVQWFSNGHVPNEAQGVVKEHGTYFTVATLEGEMTGEPGDYIIKGIKGEFYPCNPDIFEATYEPV